MKEIFSGRSSKSSEHASSPLEAGPPNTSLDRSGRIWCPGDARRRGQSQPLVKLLPYQRKWLADQSRFKIAMVAGATSCERGATGIASHRCGSEQEGKEMAAGKFSAFGSSNEATRGIAKVFREVTVYGDPEDLDALIPEIEGRLADGWSFDKESEQRLPSCGGQRFFLFPCRARAERPAVTLAMCADGRRLSVTNILLKEDRSLSCAEYNSILVEFYLRFLQPAAAELGLPIELSPDERSFEREYGSEAVRRLKRFSVPANKLMTHPADHRRFMD
jgi:hypothetical protein